MAHSGQLSPQQVWEAYLCNVISSLHGPQMDLGAADMQMPAVCQGLTCHLLDRRVNVQGSMKDVQVPSSVPQLTTKHVLTMSFVEGQPITRLRVRACHSSVQRCLCLLCCIPLLGWQKCSDWASMVACSLFVSLSLAYRVIACNMMAK